MADWSQLPHDIVESIAVRLDAVEDFLAFSAVCRSWRSFYLIKQWIPGSQLPWLMLSDDEKASKKCFFSLYRDKVYETELPEASGRRCWGSSDGWLVTIGSDMEIHLVNAFSRVRVLLPSATTFQILFNASANWYELIDKAIVIRKPSQSNDSVNEVEFLVMAIYGPFKQLAFAKPGYSSWINVEETFQHRFLDVACVNDQIFAFSASGNLLLVDVGSRVIEIMPSIPPKQRWARERVHLEGDLLMVYQNLYVEHMINHPSVEPVQFQVFKFDFSDKEWIELKDLGDRALFVGDNITISICTADAKFVKCKGNSIYFIGSKVENWWRFDEYLVDRDCGVYNVAEGTVEPFYFGADYPSYYSCPLWLTPILV
ncbi:OLC1v1036439C1 [Oldenlandia corymbosa var. corymbosa]|uniref:OLC1v1036439C1 n=1 Tax=Oldenlandia corymbosa var. corymbosa TaxID=529605 RepID=A0AAV1CWK6_OLDCO|nr:OLC1v1036439C1 [Oldenlandia corymbosa var. corymbosa]